MTISSKEALPALSPRPLIVHSTCLAPSLIAAREFATANPKSLWQCTLIVTLSINSIFDFRFLIISLNSDGTV